MTERCKLVHYAVPVDGWSLMAAGPMRAACRCETHGMDPLPFCGTTGDGEPMCPIGKIEEAAEKALVAIAAAKGAK